MLTKPFTFWMHPEQHEELRRLSYERYRSMAEILRAALTHFLQDQRSLEQIATPPQQERRGFDETTPQN